MLYEVTSDQFKFCQVRLGWFGLFHVSTFRGGKVRLVQLMTGLVSLCLFRSRLFRLDLDMSGYIMFIQDRSGYIRL
jgi:hypothetical protein